MALLHEPGLMDPVPAKVLAVYPLVPWIGVMIAGYAFGPVMRTRSGSGEAGFSAPGYF